MIKEQLQQLFRRYLNAFKAYDIDSVVNCYHIPCTLNTPDNIVLVNSAMDCQQEFNNIFIQLKQNCTSNIIAQKLSYQQVTDNVYMVCIDWEFLDGNKQVFADFSAIYHMTWSEIPLPGL